MRSVKVLVVMAGLLVACTARPALAGAPVSAPDSAGAADAGSLRAPAASPPATSWAPSRDTLDALRARVGGRVIQVWNGSDHLGLRHTHLDSTGVQFEISKQDYAPWVYKGWGIDVPRSEGGGATLPRSSRIPWALVSRIETQHSRVLLGAAAGALVGLGALGMASSSTDMWSEVGALVLAPAIVVSFGLLGSVFGGLAPGRTLAWKRPEATPRTSLFASPAAAPDSAAVADTSSSVGAAEPSRAAPSLAEAMPSTGSLALLRTRAGHRVVRVSVGEDDYKLSHARFESSGVVFSPGGQEGMSLWAGAGESPRSSPIPWDRVKCIRVQHSHVALGAVTGALLGSWVVARTIHQGAGYDEMAAAVPVVLTPLAGLVGASVGALLGGSAFATWPIAWQRAPDQHGAR